MTGLECYILPRKWWHAVVEVVDMAAANVLPLDWVDESGSKEELLEMVERRFPPSIIDRLIALGFERAAVYAVVIPARILQHRRSRNELLTLDESDRVIRLLRVLRATDERSYEYPFDLRLKG